jgi:hypothetical protein
MQLKRKQSKQPTYNRGIPISMTIAVEGFIDVPQESDPSFDLDL